MADLILLRPWWLLALIPIALAALVFRRRQRAGAWSEVMDPALVQVLERLGRLRQGEGRSYRHLPLIAAGCVALALSSPAVPKAGSTEYRALDPLVLLLDLSPSVMAEQRSRVDLQAAAAGLIAAAQGRPVGMMVYAADAYLASAPTTDTDSLLSLISVLGPETMPVAGSRPDMALSMARDLFSGAGASISGADLVLVSDGGGAGPRAVEEAARLAHDGARVWTLQLQGAAAAPQPEPGVLAALARAGGGETAAYSDSARLSERISRARVARLAREDVAAGGLRDLGPWLLPVALLALFPLFRRRR